MKLTSISFRNFLGLRKVDAAFGDVSLFAGDNWSGKTSIQHGLRFAITGEIDRVQLKKEYGMLVRDGQKSAELAVRCSHGPFPSLDVNVTLTAAGKVSRGEPVEDDQGTLPVLLDQHRFTSLSAAERRAFLLNITAGAQDNHEEIKKRLVDAGTPEEMADEILPILRGGFDAGEKEANARLRQARGEWKSITGEDYGEKKAEEWQFSTDDERGKLEPLVAQAAKRKQLVKLADEEHTRLVERTAWFEAVLAMHGKDVTCTHCGGIFKPDFKPSRDEIEAMLPEYRQGVTMLASALANRRKELDEAEQAGRRLDELKAIAERTNKSAKATHGRALAWADVARLLGPDGIPTDLIGGTIKRINDRLRGSAAVTGWGQVALHPAMHITRDNRLLPLCSEAEQWTAEAMICEAIATVTGEKFLVLDRVDVLGVKRREALLTWCDQLAQDGLQVVLFATLKAPFKVEGWRCYWLEDGALAE